MSLPDSWIGSSRRRLRLSLGLFFLAMAIPTGFLIRQTYQQLKWESYYQHRVLAEELTSRIDSRIRQMIAVEEARPRSEYGFLSLAGDPSAKFVVRSPLSGYPVRSAIPGVIGYFEINEEGTLTTPLLPPDTASPAEFGIPASEYRDRRALQARIAEILAESPMRPDADTRQRGPLHWPRTAESPRSTGGSSIPFETEGGVLGQFLAQENADESNEPGVDSEIPSMRLPRIGPPSPREWPRQRNSAFHFETMPAGALPRRGPRADARRERSVIVESRAHADQSGARLPQMAIAQVQVRIFDSEIDPLEFRRLDSGQFLLSRYVWREGRQAVQGALIDPEKFLRALVERDFRHTALSRMSELDVTSWDSSIIRFSASESQRFLTAQEGWRGQVLHRAQLPAPLNDIKLVFRITKLPAGPGAAMVGWLGGILAAVLCGGIWLLYRLGLRQIAATRQQQDFVSAVSHELKTPLTSIRMYGEMLREGWVPEERRGGCYDFICAESERLSRLIENVLQLARMTRGGPSFELKTTTAGDLLNGVLPRIAAQMERAGFTLHVLSDARAAVTMIKVDEDSFAQIVINLIDNALKFSAKSADRRIELSCNRGDDRTVLIGVRDFGPGIPRDRLSKIFRPFYRGENERVRETVGTGIGLALVRQLAAAMNARVDVVNREPGAEFRIWFRSWDATESQTETQPV